MNSKKSQNSQTPQAPKLPPNLEVLSLPDERLQDDEEYADAKLVQGILAGQTAKGLRFQRLFFKTVSFAQTRLQAPRLIDVRFEDCDLANANWERASGQRLAWLRCQMLGFAAAEASWQDAFFRQCNGQLAQFRFAQLRAARFEECDLTDADFYGADLTGVHFVKCNLTNVELSHAKLAGADLRTCTLEGIKAGAPELMGAIVTPMQAAYLAGRMGLVVKQIDEEIF